jgi:hypothetical protein
MGTNKRAEDKKGDQDAELAEDEIPLYGDENGSIGLELADVEAGSEISVEIFGEGFLGKSKWSGTIDDDSEIDDMSVTFAAYVNENHPWIDGLLKEALSAAREHELINGFTGYQLKSQDEVLSQVFAIWNALQRRGIKYSDVSTTTPSKSVYSQTVRPRQFGTGGSGAQVTLQAQKQGV